MAESNGQAGGIGLCGVLFIVFLVLKLTGTIAWSYWWIFAPLWIPFGLGFLIGLILVLAGADMSKFQK
jgi:hypothetical protein